MAKQLISDDREWMCKSSDPLETDNVGAGSTMHIVDTGEQYIFFDGAWVPDLRLAYAIKAAQLYSEVVD